MQLPQQPEQAFYSPRPSKANVSMGKAKESAPFPRHTSITDGQREENRAGGCSDHEDSDFTGAWG